MTDGELRQVRLAAALADGPSVTGADWQRFEELASPALIEAMAGELLRLRKAVRFYANAKNYDYADGGSWAVVMDDGGAAARRALGRGE